MIVWTIRVSLAFYVLALALLIAGRGSSWKLARAAWTLAFLFYLAHIVAAFHFAHDWSHANAYEHTARRTAEVVGLDWGGGLYVNYIFTAAWLIDVGWRWVDAAGYRSRQRWITWLLGAFFAFIAINATIIFAAGPIRWAGIAACVALVVLWLSIRLQKGERPV